MMTFYGQRANAVLGVVATAGASSATTATAAIDRIGFKSAIIEVTVVASAATGGSVQIGFTEGAATATTSAVTLSTSGPSIAAAASSCNIYFLDLTGFHRYFMVQLTRAFTATATADTVSCNVILADPDTDPIGYGGSAGSVQTMYHK